MGEAQLSVRWAPHLVAAGVLTLGLVGDAVMYAVLPASAATYGLGAVGVAAVLSVNRFARLALNPLAARWLARVGLRRGGVVGALLALFSTAGYAVAPGAGLLLAARLAWGAAFATLRLTVQGYATSDHQRASRRLGNAAALQELAPALMLVIGTAALAPLGVRGLFLALAGLAALAIPLALALPRAPASHGVAALGAADAADAVARRPAPWGPGGFAASVAFGVDGVLMAGIVLALMAAGWAPVAAAQLGAALLAGRKVGQVLLAPVAGRLGERLGAARVVGASGGVTALGLSVMALTPVSGTALVIGAIVAMLAGTVVATLVPATVGADGIGERMRQLGWLANARDLGAAVGAAVGPLLLVGARDALPVSWAFGSAAVLVLIGGAAWRLAAPGAARPAVGPRA